MAAIPRPKLPVLDLVQSQDQPQTVPSAISIDHGDTPDPSSDEGEQARDSTESDGASATSSEVQLDNADVGWVTTANPQSRLHIALPGGGLEETFCGRILNRTECDSGLYKACGTDKQWSPRYHSLLDKEAREESEQWLV